MRFDGDIAVVTGSARGIGHSIARHLYDNGATVVLSDLKIEDLETAARSISGAADGRLEKIPCDVSNQESVDSMFDAIKQKHGRLDLLVNNAGITRDNLFMRMKREEWQAVIDVNLTGMFFCCRAGVSLLRKSEHGRIVNISSVAAKGNPGQANYAASKSGVIGLTKTLALELARYGITVNAIAPGFIETEMTRAIPEKARETWLQKIPANRPGHAEDVASAVLFLLSGASSYITGQVIGVDGGMSI